MARSTEKEIISFIRMVHQEHVKYWGDKAQEMKRYKDSYENKFWADEKGVDNTMVRIETADCFSYIEGFIASLFAKNPAVVVGPDVAASTGQPEKAQAVANRFLFNKREQIEIASRLALIYDYAALKLSPSDSDEMLDKVTIRAIPCWEVILDRDASSYTDQRFVGHNYYITVVEAREKFGAKKFNPVPKEDYFKSSETNYGGNRTYADLPDDYLYVELVELYDLLHDQVYYWSPNYANGDKLLERATIPVRTYNDNPLPPISCLFYSRCPSKPMEGMSAVSRVYDQIYEKNILRTYWANSVRRDSRQYLYKEGVVDEEALAKITAGLDGAMIPVDADSLDGVIQAVGVEPISTNFDRYQAQIEADLSRGSILAPFTRGEATKATATEITALAQYSASEIGKMARDRDNAIENIVTIYLRQLVLLSDEGETAVLEVDGKGSTLTADDLEGKFRIHALDQGFTPLSDTIKKQNLLNLVPVLTGLGVDPTKIRDELIRMYELPEDFRDAPEAPQAPAMAPSAEAQAAPEGSMTDAEQLSAQLGTVGE